jgi:DNA (cytosine-5)-methyltransferase 1
VAIPVIDLFAGPGGLGEGFSAFCDSNGERRFKIALSVEKDLDARKTLLLRTFLREFPDDTFPASYYDFLRNIDEPQQLRFEKLFAAFPNEFKRADKIAMLAELGGNDSANINQKIGRALRGSDECVLIGGPPCQAYSLAGRSRNKGVNDYVAHEDKRQFLYVEYLQVIADRAPALFVMENVKGLLSATVKRQAVFHRISEDLHDPVRALIREGRITAASRSKLRSARYRLYSLAEAPTNGVCDPSDFIVQMENFGIPQSRHRLILLGIRDDIEGIKPTLIRKSGPVAARLVLDGLPRIRSGLSRETDSDAAWISALEEARTKRWLAASKNKAGNDVYSLLVDTIENLHAPALGTGAEFIHYDAAIGYRPDWYLDKDLDGVCNHSGRSHMTQDLFRYLYASCFAVKLKRSPRLSDFPADLLPDHANTEKALDGGNFNDRFRVQLRNVPSTTVTSHISKDGHYYIHPDPTQCRSLTVREAARLQTFPDNYFFCGPKTSQYIQVGNAVPPLLAHEIAKVSYAILKKAGIS